VTFFGWAIPAILFIFLGSPVTLTRVLAGELASHDSWCPAYPPSHLRQTAQHIADEQALHGISAPKKPVRPQATARNNFIDEYIFRALDKASISPAPLADDATFLRRVKLDLTGRIPSRAEVDRFLGDRAANKRSNLVDSLLGTPEFADYWAQWLGNLFQVTSGWAGILPDSSSGFHKELSGFLSADRSYADLVRDLITATGATNVQPLASFLARGRNQFDPAVDVLDEVSIKTVRTFLGVPIQCVSCHDGAYHLEQINLFLAGKTREQFWRQAAFFSPLNFTTGAKSVAILSDVSETRAPGYVAEEPADNPGGRPPRGGGTYGASYFFGKGNEAPTSRLALANTLTADPQFARATVNYLWAHFFRIGIVDPPDAWDLNRIDPDQPPPDPWPLQPSHPALLDDLAEEFIQSGYNLRAMIRLMTTSSAYQLSSEYHENLWRDEYTRLFARHLPRRLTAEELYDALGDATGTSAPIDLLPLPLTVDSAQEIPDPTFPRFDPAVKRFFTILGRGDRLLTLRDSRPNPLQLLYWMNDPMIVDRTLGSGSENRRTSLPSKLSSLGLDDREALRTLYVTTIGRYPSKLDQERAFGVRTGIAGQERWLSDLQWALLNSVEFVFNH